MLRQTRGLSGLEGEFDNVTVIDADDWAVVLRVGQYSRGIRMDHEQARFLAKCLVEAADRSLIRQADLEDAEADAATQAHQTSGPHLVGKET